MKIIFNTLTTLAFILIFIGFILLSTLASIVSLPEHIMFIKKPLSFTALIDIIGGFGILYSILLNGKRNKRFSFHKILVKNLRTGFRFAFGKISEDWKHSATDAEKFLKAELIRFKGKLFFTENRFIVFRHDGNFNNEKRK
ncbi:MAG: hypothetical protein NT007_08390 [Candidatus Kapabacteria bacterium]|nr:hypothetical protein [Candidatus Kapabacteria bacterium]